MTLARSQGQSVLLDRLLTQDKWLSEGKRPVKVIGVYGFGSFFQGKLGRVMWNPARPALSRPPV